MDLCAQVMQQIEALHVATPPRLPRIRTAPPEADATRVGDHSRSNHRAAESVSADGTKEALASRGASIPTATPFDWDRYSFDTPPKGLEHQLLYDEELPSGCDSDSDSDGPVNHRLRDVPAVRCNATTRPAEYGKAEVRRSLFSSPRTLRNEDATERKRYSSLLRPFGTASVASPAAAVAGGGGLDASMPSSAVSAASHEAVAAPTFSLPALRSTAPPQSYHSPEPYKGCEGGDCAQQLGAWPSDVSAFSSCESDRSFFSPDSLDECSFPRLQLSARGSPATISSAKRTADAATPRSPRFVCKRRRKLMPRLFGHHRS